MNNKGFKYKLAIRKINSVVLKNKREVNFPSLNSIKRVGIVGYSEIEKKDIQLSIDGDIQVLMFSSEKRDKGDNSDGIFVNDLNFIGLPSKMRAHLFIETAFDVLICLENESSPAVEFVCGKSQAKFKVGKFKSIAFDLVIDQKGMTNKAFIDEIKNTIRNFS